MPDGARDRAHFRGCLLGGAVGDALGAPVEFMSLSAIRQTYGPGGIADFTPAYGKLGAITDDTQMTLFTAEGVLRARSARDGAASLGSTDVVHRAYLRWLRTQVYHAPGEGGGDVSGWLVGVPELNARRAPGTTCLGALVSGRAGTVAEPINTSKGCGGVMRAAPAGLIGDGDPFRLGCETAAITHGHPSGYLAAGCLALMIDRIISGEAIGEAVAAARARVAREPGHGEVSAALDNAMRAAEQGPATADRVESLGAGWVADEALGIAVYCALAAADAFEQGVRLAVNHGGDSDSTGAIAGTLLGAALGVAAIPERWLANVELRDVIERVADDLVVGYEVTEAWAKKYPGA